MSQDLSRFEILSPIASRWKGEEQRQIADSSLHNAGVIDDKTSARSDHDQDPVVDSSDSDTLEPAPIAHSLELESPLAPLTVFEDDEDASPNFARAHELRIRALRDSVRKKQRGRDTVWTSPPGAQQQAIDSLISLSPEVSQHELRNIAPQQQPPPRLDLTDLEDDLDLKQELRSKLAIGEAIQSSPSPSPSPSPSQLRTNRVSPFKKKSPAKARHASRSPAFEDWTPAQWSRLVKDVESFNLRPEDLQAHHALPQGLLQHFPGSSDYSLRLRLQTLFKARRV